MSIHPGPAEPLRLRVKQYVLKSAFVRDFTFVRNFTNSMLRELRNALRKLPECDKQAPITPRISRIFGEESISDSVVKLGTLLLKWHEHDLRRANPGQDGERIETPFEEVDREIIERLLERKGVRPE